MAFGTTDRVETTAWRSQPQRAAPTPRAADPTRPRFDEALPQAEAPKAAATADRPTRPDRTSTDRKETARTARRDTGHRDQTHGTRDATVSSPKRPDASGTPKTKKPEADATDQAASGDADSAAAKPESTGEPPKATETQATPTPVIPGSAPLAPPIPTGLGAAQAGTGPLAGGTDQPSAATPAGDGGPSTAAIPAGVSRGAPIGTPMVEGSQGGDDGSETDAAASGATKDFLAALSDAGQSGTQAADPIGATLSPAAPSGTQPAGASAATAHAAPGAPEAPAIPLGQVPMTIGLRSLAGSSEFQIRLDPADLGRIDVKLDIDKAKGTVATHLTVERPDTLALLQRDAGQLQQALTQAGLDSSAGGVSLSLRSDGGGQANGQGGQQGGGDGRPTSPWSTDRAETLQETTPMQRLRGYGGLDIRI